MLDETPTSLVAERSGGPSRSGTPHRSAYAAQRLGTRLARGALGELSGIDARAVLGRALTALLPTGGACRVRAMMLRATGLAVGDRTLILACPTVIGGSRAWRNVSIGSDTFVNAGCVLDATAPITIGDRVALGPGVLITTSSHLIGAPDRRSGLLIVEPVVVGDGAWLASRAVVLPGVTIGEGAVVGAGAVVTDDVAPHSFVGGVPARTIRPLDAPDS
jgi:maltose O-acetyltransferase